MHDGDDGSTAAKKSEPPLPVRMCTQTTEHGVYALNMRPEKLNHGAINVTKF